MALEMVVARCGGCGTGTGTSLTALRTTASRRADGRRGTTISFSPCSRPHRVSTLVWWPLRCSPAPSHDMEEQRVGKKKKNEEWEGLKAEITRTFRPLLHNLAEIYSLRHGYELEDYHIGMLFGAFLGSVGCYKLWKAAPSIFVDVSLAFLFYKLSIVSSELHQHRKSNSLTTGLKFGTILVMVLKDIKKNYVLLDVIRMPVFLLYICAFLFDVTGMKKYGRCGLVSLVNLLKMRGGLQEIWRIMWCPGYVSPYDDGADWSEVLRA